MAKNNQPKNNNDAVALFAANQLARKRGGGGGGSAGGRYNPRTRRLTVPRKFAGKKIGVAVADDVIICGGAGEYSCHSAQSFITMPAGVVTATVAMTLSPCDLPEAFAELGDDYVAYKLPKAK